MTDTYRARRRLEMQPGVWREPGELVPEAHTWHRLDSYLHTGYIVEAQVSTAEFQAAVATYCPELTDRLNELAGVTADLEGPHRTPRAREAVVVPLKGRTKKAATTEE